MKKVISLILIIVFFYFNNKIYQNFKNDSLFTVEKVDVESGNERLLGDLISNLKKLNGFNILEIEERKLEDELEKDIRLKSVKVIRQIPDKLIIKLKGKKAFSYVELANKFYIADEDGEIYGYMGENKVINLPIIRLGKKENLETYMKILKKLTYRDEVSQIYRIPHGIVITLNDGMKFVTNEEVKSKKYEIGRQLYYKLKDVADSDKERRKIEKRLKAIDLRFNDYIIRR